MNINIPLERAREYCFFFDARDIAALLCRHNVIYGIAKIQNVQKQLGYPQDASFISSPDSTITRNITRWKAGFGYGGRIDWSGDFFPLELKPNACGVLLAGLQRKPDIEKLRIHCQEMAEKTYKLNGINLEWDFGTSNHFINVYKAEKGTISGYKYFVIIHGSGKELRGKNKYGPGLYLDESETLHDKSERVSTPWGFLHILKGANAREFYEYYKIADDFSKKRREMFMKLIDIDAGILFNETHQGLLSQNTSLLGCYAYISKKDKKPWYPVTLRADLPAYLVKPLDIYSIDTLKRNGFMDRAQKYDIVSRLNHANIIPHGGGYSLPEIKDFTLRLDGEERVYDFQPYGHGYTNIRTLPYEYRGKELINTILEFSVGKIVATLNPLISLTIKT